MKNLIGKIAAASAAGLLLGNAWAADSGTGTMAVTASIADECSVGNAAALAFGQLTMLSGGSTSGDASTSSGGTFDVICTNGTSTPKLRFTSANVGLGTDFRLVGADGTTFITYTLKESNGSTAIVYNSDAAFNGLTADGASKSLRIIGSIAAAEKSGKPKQAYTDTITITTSFGAP